MVGQINIHNLPVSHIGFLPNSRWEYPRVLRVKDNLTGHIKLGFESFRWNTNKAEEALAQAGVFNPQTGLLDVDKLKTLAADHPLFGQMRSAGHPSPLMIRKSELQLSPEEFKDACIASILGRHSLNKSELLELTPTADNLYHLADVFLQNGEIEEARFWADEAAKYDTADKDLTWIKRITAYWIKEKQRERSRLTALGILIFAIAKDLDAQPTPKIFLIRFLTDFFPKLCAALSIPLPVDENELLLFRGHSGVDRTTKERVLRTESINCAITIARMITHSIEDFFNCLSLIIEFVAALRTRKISENGHLAPLEKIARTCDLSSMLPKLLKAQLQDCRSIPLASNIATILRESCNRTYASTDCGGPDGGASTVIPCLRIGGEKVEGGFLDGDMVESALTIAYLFSLYSSPSEIAANLSAIIDFTHALAEKGILPGPYLIGLRALINRFPEYKGQLDAVLEQERKPAFYPLRQIGVTYHWFCEEARMAMSRNSQIGQPQAHFEKELPRRYLPEELAILEQQFKGIAPSAPSPDKETEKISRLINEARLRNAKEFAYITSGSGHCVQLAPPLCHIAGLVTAPEKENHWREMNPWVLNNTDDNTVIACAYEISRLFSDSAAELAANFEAVIEFIGHLAQRGLLAQDYLTTLSALGKRFPEYKGKLKSIIEKELERGYSPSRDRTASATLEWYCDDVHHHWDVPCSLPQLIPWYETELLPQRFSPEEIAAIRERRKFPAKKCLVLDADQVLWAGIVDEDGIPNLRPLVDFQKRIKAAKEKGTLLALSSRNEKSLIEETFRAYPDMPLQLIDFSAVEVNWDPKAENIVRIARGLGLGLGSFVFLDDSVLERAMVKRALPQVLTPDLPLETRWYDSFFQGLEEIFTRPTVTEEAGRRTELYADLEAVKSFLDQSGSREAGLRALEAKASICRAGPEAIPRLAEITQRTNQFNLTTIRYQEAELQSFLNDPNYRLFQLKVTAKLPDRVADMGTVGLIIAHRESATIFTIDTFALSCRALVLDNIADQTFFAQAAKALKGEGVQRLKATYIPSGCNQQVADLYARLGFRKIKGEDNGTTHWELDLTNADIRPSPLIEILE